MARESRSGSNVLWFLGPLQFQFSMCCFWPGQYKLGNGPEAQQEVASQVWQWEVGVFIDKGSFSCGNAGRGRKVFVWKYTSNPAFFFSLPPAPAPAEAPLGKHTVSEVPVGNPFAISAFPAQSLTCKKGNECLSN